MTIKDIARLAGVSVATVSRVLNNKDKGVGDGTRARILRIIEETGYQPSPMARNLVLRKSRIIGLVVEDLQNPYYGMLMKGVQDGAREKGYNIILCNAGNSDERENHNLDFLTEQNVCGIIYNSFNKEKDFVLERIVKNKIPMVFVDGRGNMKGGNGIHVDNARAMEELVDRLVMAGHRTIGCLTGERHINSSEQRLAGYAQALEKNGIPLDPRLVVETKYLIAAGRLGMERLLERNIRGLTAVVCCNDLIAIGALECLQDKGIQVPEEISVTGFDDIDMCRHVRPRLTTVSQPNYDIGRVSVEMLIRLVEQEDRGRVDEVVFLPKVVVRESARGL
ncbi:LacI family DNA-binding transcriptional regulator [Anaerotalea alkaliphila]|uniref:LacI family transcriptional regulator n=1 Tax=Anaerotalea alkaliphila TaxID=2662126 RepID=A0A7X5HX67_9FIRM|nr:LacI family DNA-binding transcriptional regulator [Anaerotalea alkaliphila]NDL68307.1 LacI family transcriptional regulator [Anaerotalea alkaliphila]